LGHMEDEKIAGFINGDVIKEGMLHKQTRKGDWKIKLCQLIGSEFRWLSNDPSNYKEDKELPAPRSIFTLKSNVTLWPVMDRPFCFAISASRGCFYFAATSGTERMSWVNTIRSCIRKHLQQIKEATPVKKALKEEIGAVGETTSSSKLTALMGGVPKTITSKTTPPKRLSGRRLDEHKSNEKLEKPEKPEKKKEYKQASKNYD